MSLPWPARQITFKPPNLVQVLNPAKRKKKSQHLVGKSLAGEGGEKGRGIRLKNESGGRERAAKRRPSASESFERRRLVLERQRLIKPVSEPSQWERSRGCEKSERDRQRAEQEEGSKGGEEEEEERGSRSERSRGAHTPKEPILANGWPRVRPNPRLSAWLIGRRGSVLGSSRPTWGVVSGLEEREGCTHPPTLGEASLGHLFRGLFFSVRRGSVGGASVMSMLIATQQIDTTTSKMVSRTRCVVCMLSRSLVSASRVSSLLLLSGPCGFSWRQLCSKLPFSYMFGWIVAGFVALVPHREVYYECAPGPFCPRTAGSTLRTRECDTVQQGSFFFFFSWWGQLGPCRLSFITHSPPLKAPGPKAGR